MKQPRNSRIAIIPKSTISGVGSTALIAFISPLVAPEKDSTCAKVWLAAMMNRIITESFSVSIKARPIFSQLSAR